VFIYIGREMDTFCKYGNIMLAVCAHEIVTSDNLSLRLCIHMDKVSMAMFANFLNICLRWRLGCIVVRSLAGLPLERFCVKIWTMTIDFSVYSKQICTFFYSSFA